MKVIVLTGLALIAFAANSVLCRLALGSHAIDPASFTIIRLLSGAVMLLFILSITRRHQTSPHTSRGSWSAAWMLFIYASTFSYAYISLDTGTGALILFAAVQITMVLLSILSGNRLQLREWAGMCIAFAGFVYLVLPAISSPSASGFILMTISGIAWGVYTMQGRNSSQPLQDTAHQFFKTIPMVLLLAIMVIDQSQLTWQGIILATISGSITSAIGYTMWYIALGSLTSTLAAVLQLSVPVLAAIGGILFVGEAITLRLVIATACITGGVALVLLSKKPEPS